MTKLFMALTLVSLFMMTACGKSGSSSTASEQQATTSRVESADTVDGTGATVPIAVSNSEATISSTSTLPAKAHSFTVNVAMINFTAEQKAKYNKAVDIVKKVVATEAFRSRVLNFTYNGVKQFVDNAGLTNAQIYQSILDGAELLKPVKNNTMDLGVRMYFQDSNVIGYENPDELFSNVNTKYFDNFTANQVAANLFHEWLHKLGYHHDVSATPQRPSSVPYAIGYIVRDLGTSFL